MTLPSELVYDCVCDLIHVMLNSVDKFQDVKNMKDILSLVGAIYLPNEKEKQYVREGIKSHPMWHKEHNWELIMVKYLRDDLLKITFPA